MSMDGILKCPKHNLPQQIVCIGQFCPQRIGCELCIGKHDHKFYLDAKNTQKNVVKVKQEIQQKLLHLNNYTVTNVKSLKLPTYRQKLIDQFQEERLFLKNKLQQERINFKLWIEKSQKVIKESLDKYQKEILQYWDAYYSQAQRHLDSEKQYKQLMEHFKVGNWTTHDHVEQSVNFLYSQELLFRFNRSLDRLKKQINHYKHQNQQILAWFYKRRVQFQKFQLCPIRTFQGFVDLYKQLPNITPYKKDYTKQYRDDHNSVLSVIGSSQSKALMIYPKIIYEPFQSIDKIIRYNNNLFATTGGRSINLWTRVSMNPQKSYALDFPSYGISTFMEYGQEDPQMLLYGKSNGQIGQINVQAQTVKEMDAHQGAVRDIIQIDQHHFLTCSYDWLIKVWGLNHDPKDKNFANQRLTLKGSSGKVHCLCKFGPSVLSAGADNTIRLWDVMRSSFDQTFIHQKQVHALAQIRPQFFASGGELKQLRVWDYRKTKTPLIRYNIDHCINTILRYDQNTIIFNDKNMVKIIDIRNFKQPLARFQNSDVYSHTISSMTFLSDVQIGMGGSDGFVTLWKY